MGTASGPPASSWGTLRPAADGPVCSEANHEEPNHDWLGVSLMGLRTPPDDGGRGMPPWPAALVVVGLVAALGIAVRGWLLVGPGSHPATKPRPTPSLSHSPSLSLSPPPAPGSDEENANGANAATSTVVAGPPGPYGPTAAWVVAENAKPGTPNWALGNRARQHQIEGYADRASIDVSGTVHLLVSTTAPAFKVEAYRMGYYGGGGGAPLRGPPPPPPAGEPRAAPLAGSHNRRS